MEARQRRELLDGVIATMRTERANTWYDPAQLAAECEDVLERCRFDRDQALAVLRGERDLDDDPWQRCPRCGCDTYLRVHNAIGSAPVTMFVCEGCQHLAMRARMTVDDGPWWNDGVRVQPAPPAGVPYRDETSAAESPAADAPPEVPVDWQERRVCSDGACVGIIGDQGRCNVCGRPAE